MRLSCPVCGASGSLEHWLQDADARQTLAVLAELPGCCFRPAIDYLALFRAPRRGLRWATAERLAGELREMIRAGHVERRGQRVRTTAEVFADAMRQMAEQRGRLSLPLKSHGYLLEIICGSAPRREAEAEAEQDAARQSASRGRAAPSLQDDPLYGARAFAYKMADIEQSRRRRAGEPAMTEAEIQALLLQHGVAK